MQDWDTVTIEGQSHVLYRMTVCMVMQVWVCMLAEREGSWLARSADRLEDAAVDSDDHQLPADGDHQQC